MPQQYVVIATLRGRLKDNARFLVFIFLFCCSGVGELLAKLLRIDLVIKMSNRNWKFPEFYPKADDIEKIYLIPTDNSCVDIEKSYKQNQNMIFNYKIDHVARELIIARPEVSIFNFSILNIL